MAQVTNTANVAYTESGVNLNIDASVNFNVLGENMTVVKTCNPLLGVVGTTVTYTLTITNTNVLTTVNNVIVKDPLNPRLSLVAGSVKLGGSPLAGSLTAGINIGNIPPLGIRVVTYDCTVLPA